MNKSKPLTRREFAKMIGAVSFLGPAVISTSVVMGSELSLDELLSEPIISEPQFGDPLGANDKYETLTLVHPSQQKAVGDDPVYPIKDPEQLALRMLQITRQFVD